MKQIWKDADVFLGYRADSCGTMSSSGLFPLLCSIVCLQCDAAVITALPHVSQCQPACLPHRTCRRTGVWGPDCRAPGGLCRSTAAGVSCTWAPSTRSEGTWLWVQRLVGSCRAVAIPEPADLKYGDNEAGFYHYCRSRGGLWGASLVTAADRERQQQCTQWGVCSMPRKVISKKVKNPCRILVQVHAVGATCDDGLSQRFQVMFTLIQVMSELLQ